MSLSAVLFQIQSILILGLFAYGVFLIKQSRAKESQKKHSKVMITGMVWDILLILQIELGRSAILKASKAVENPMMLNIHVAIAVATVILYVPTTIFGRQMLNHNNYKNRKAHKILGIATIGMRLLTFITSFFAVA